MALFDTIPFHNWPLDDEPNLHAPLPYGQVSLDDLVMPGGAPTSALLTDRTGDAHYVLGFVVREE